MPSIPPRRPAHRLQDPGSWRARAFLAACLALGIVASGASAASETSVVSATVPSATSLDVSACSPNTAGVTMIGTVLPGGGATTTIDCDISFGSSNDTAALRVQQVDRWDTAMTRTAWQDVASAATGCGQITSIWVGTGGDRWYTGTCQVFRRSTDGGASWTPSTLTGATDNPLDVDSGDDGATGWVVGHDAQVWRSDDGGATWTQQATGAPASESFLDVDAIDDQVAWTIGGGFGMVYRTTDGGASWTGHDSATGGAYHYGLHALSASTAWAVGRYGVVRITTDGGSSWSSPPDVPGSPWLRGVHAWDDQSAIVVGDGGFIARTDDGGASWTTLPAAGTANPDSIMIDDSGFGWIADQPSGMLHTTDDGATWAPFPTPWDGTGGVNVVTGPDAQSAWAVGWDGASGGYAMSVGDIVVPDYADGVDDWDLGGGFFGACLRAVGAATTATWTADATCQQADGAWWNAIPAGAPTQVAASDVGSTTSVASLRFGMKASASQPTGTYRAGVEFSVVAPAA